MATIDSGSRRQAIHLDQTSTMFAIWLSVATVPGDVLRSAGPRRCATDETWMSCRNSTTTSSRTSA